MANIIVGPYLVSTTSTKARKKENMNLVVPGSNTRFDIGIFDVVFYFALNDTISRRHSENTFSKYWIWWDHNLFETTETFHGVH
jgi:hypothetical protein